MSRFISFLLVFFGFTGCSSKILYHSTNEFGPIWVEERSDMRCLSFAPVEESSVRQTCIMLDDPKKLVFKYQKAMLSALYINPKPQKILMLGLGGGTLVTAVSDIVKAAHFDVVDINPEVEKVAQKYFGFQSKSANVVIQDGYDFVANAEKAGLKYDIIFLDTFSPKYIPKQFLTEQFVQNVKSILAPQGVVVVNTFLGRLETGLENSLYKNTFGEFFNIDLGGNRLIMAINGSFPDDEAIGKNALALKSAIEEYGVTSKWLLAVYGKGYMVAK